MKKEFTFSNDAAHLYQSVLDVMSFIEQASPGLHQTMTSRCRVIVTELLTNGIKHAGNQTSHFTVTKHEDCLQLIKKDRGNLFFPNGHEEHEQGKKIILSSDPLTDLYAVLESENKFKFFALDHPFPEEVPVQGLLEHFGLQLITKASDQFYYEYHPEQQLNVFRAVVLF